MSITFSTGYFIGKRGFELEKKGFKIEINRDTPADKNLNFTLFWKVWDTVTESYYDKSKIAPKNMVYGAIKGMVDSIGDPYTTFLTPSENQVIQEDLQGNFEGIGIQIGFRGTQLAVVAPLPGSPAEKAGIKAGDYIIGVKDEAKGIDRGTVGISLPEAVQTIRGTAGTKVTLALLRNGSDQPIIVDVTRASIDVPSVSLAFVGKDKSIAHIRLLKFGGETTTEWESSVLEVLKNPDLKGVIVDLRNNTGGYLQGAVDIASEFLEVGDVVVIEEKGSGERNEFKVERMGKLKKEPLVILVNKGSASASEILAGALRDDKKTFLIGTTTFGKGTIQEPLEIENGAGLHITTAKWLTPSKFWVNEVGLDPDVKIEDDPETPEDEQLNEAIKVVENQ